MKRSIPAILVLAAAAILLWGCGGGGSSESGSTTVTVSAPTFSLAPGTYASAQSVTLSTSTVGASIRYTMDGSTPTSTTGTPYAGPIAVSATTTVKAMAYMSGLVDSGVTSGTYTITIAGTVSAPTFSPAPGTYASAQSVTLSTSTVGASIRYTTDGSNPTSTTGTPYAGAIAVSATTTVKAIAYMSGLVDSGVTSGTYTITVTVSVPAITAGIRHTVALKSDGTVWAWGIGGNGELGNGTGTDSSYPVQVLDGVAAVAAGISHTVALKSDGTVWTWGWNPWGAIGNGTTTNQLQPVQVTGLSGVFTSVAAGWQHTVALKSDGTVWTWGSNVFGQLGNGTSTDSLLPVQVTGLSGVFVAVGAGYSHTIAIKSDGTLWVWGRDDYLLGDGTIFDPYAPFTASPVQVTGLPGVVAAGGGYHHTVALKGDGTLWAWGWNEYGQVGVGPTKGFTPLQVLDGVVVGGAAYYHTVALKSDGTVWVWGWNEYGQVGTGNTTDQFQPVQMTTLSGVSAVTAGWYNSFAFKSDGTVWGWGYNNNHELGDGTIIQRLNPVQVMASPGVAFIIM